MAKARFRSALAGRDAHIRTLRVALVCLTTLSIFSMWGWHQAGKDITVHNPPDLTSGTSRPWWEVPKPNVYGFAAQIFTQINRWSTDGNDDYERNLHDFKPYLTPQCQATLREDLSQKLSRGELSGRERSVAKIPSLGFDDWRVIVKDQDNWVVKVDLELKEWVGTQVVKQNYIRWPLKVVRYDIDRNTNPWGLALDCFDESPREIQFKHKENKQ